MESTNSSLGPAEKRKEPRSVTSEALLGDDKELLILHAGETYRLRVTRNGKLILTK